MNLDHLAEKHGTDKGPSHHHYTRLYERYLDRSEMRLRGTLLELGWGGHEDPDAGGASARMWRDWLPGWRIVVVDNEQKTIDVARDLGINFWLGDQADPEFIARVAKQRAPFDVIIDDASHLSSLTIKSFELLWPHLKPGGWYVVEDTHQAYHEDYYGYEEANANPDLGLAPSGGWLRGAFDGAVTAMGFLKRLADEANFKGRSDWDLFPPQYSLGYEVEEIHFHFNICFIRKRG